jgi:ABC-type uncharacterized transport system substrate-binding protein
MKIGLTYDLKEDYLKEGYGQEEVAEFDKLETIEEIEIPEPVTQGVSAQEIQEILDAAEKGNTTPTLGSMFATNP